MAQVHTHYDNLKVARNAPPDVIRAAYKTLSQRFHPDRNPGNAEASRIMAIINTSYDVLSDPEKRREHDRWIAEMEAATPLNNQTNQAPLATAQYSAQHSALLKLFVPVFNLIKWLVIQVLSYAIGIGAAIGAIWVIGSAIDLFGGKSPPPPGPKPYQANPAPVRPEYVKPGWRGSELVSNSPAPVRPEYVRPSAAPNGQPWPIASGYVKGYQRLHADGLSTVTVDNSRNDFDVFVKLVSLDGKQAYPVRQFYISAFGSFTLNKVTAGSYDIRYRDLSNGGLSRSEAFSLEEIPSYASTQFSNITMTLYKVQNGNMQTYVLSEAEF
ncbi:MAG: J domain-containing protein [Rhodocyclales bacterium]|nr:J domain-containing protein [Rhodocyclales bacterium]